MRVTVFLFASVVGVLMAAGSAAAQTDNKAVPVPAVGAPGQLPGFQPGQPGFQPGQPPGFQPGQPPDPQKMQEMMRQQMAKMLGIKLPPPALKWGGMVLEPAADALLDQLNLPAAKGMIIAGIESDSAAAEAGLKMHDLVIKVNQDAVPADARELLKALGEGKSEPVDLVVIRKGKEQTLKAVKLPRAAMATPSIPGFPLPPAIGVPPGGQGDFSNAKVSFNRDKERFTVDFEHDKLQVKVRGAVAGGQSKVEEITVQEGKDEPKKYQKIEDVPQSLRLIVGRLVQMANGNPGSIVPMPPVPPVPPNGLVPPKGPTPPVPPNGLVPPNGAIPPVPPNGLVPPKGPTPLVPPNGLVPPKGPTLPVPPNGLVPPNGATPPPPNGLVPPNATPPVPVPPPAKN
jgi:hypothetical protein